MFDCVCVPNTMPAPLPSGRRPLASVPMKLPWMRTPPTAQIDPASQTLPTERMPAPPKRLITSPWMREPLAPQMTSVPGIAGDSTRPLLPAPARLPSSSMRNTALSPRSCVFALDPGCEYASRSMPIRICHSVELVRIGEVRAGRDFRVADAGGQLVIRCVAADLGHVRRGQVVGVAKHRVGEGPERRAKAEVLGALVAEGDDELRDVGADVLNVMQ